MNSKITWIGYYLPQNKITSSEIEHRIFTTFASMPHGIIKEMTWVESRYFVSEGEYASDLATKAATIALKNSGIYKEEIELLIFASASQDIIEPATANIIQKNLGMSCPVFDVKNACNSFMNGLDIADSFIKCWKYKNILICSGETPSKVIKFDVSTKDEFKNYFAGYTFGDAGSAIVLSKSEENDGILFRYFYSDGSDWNIATIMWWGARFPHDDSKNYFSGNPWKIRDKFISLDYNEFHAGLDTLGWKLNDIKKVFVHQVAMNNFNYMYESLGIEKEKFKVILPETGNIASCCIVTSLAKSFEENEIQKGDKIALIWFASGFSYGIIFYQV